MNVIYKSFEWLFKQSLNFLLSLLKYTKNSWNNKEPFAGCSGGRFHGVVAPGRIFLDFILLNHKSDRKLQIVS